MRVTVPALALIILVACSSGDEPDRMPTRMPTTVSELLLARDSDEMPPVAFPHALHQDPEIVGRSLDCAECHHTLADLPGSVPMKCGDCHPHASDEDQPAPDV